MRKSGILIALSVVVVLFITGCNGQGGSWTHDIEQFRELVLETHPKFSDEHLAILDTNVERRAAFESAIDELLLNISYLDDSEIIVALQRAAATLADNHFVILLAELETQEVVEIYPLGFRFLADGFYLLTTESGFEDALNQRLLAINGREIDDIFAEFSILWSVENIYNARSSFARLLNNPHILSALNLHENEDVTFIFANGSEITLYAEDTVLVDTSSALFFPAFSLNNREPGNLPFFMDIRGRDLNGYNWFYYMEVYSILYIRLEMYFQNTDDVGIFAPFSSEVKAAFEIHAPQAVIVDARHNPGGDNAYIMELFEFLAEHTNDGMLFHFVDEGSMSASMLGAAHLKSLGAVLIGQPLGQNTDFFGFHTTSVSAEGLSFSGLEWLEDLDLDEYVDIGTNTDVYPYFEIITLTVREILEMAEASENIAAPITWGQPYLHVNIPNMFLSASQLFGLDLEFYALRPHILIEYTIQDWISNHDPLLAYVITRLG